MQDKFFLENINYLFSQKKFEEVFLKIKKNSHFLKNYPDLFNISGVSQILKFNYNKSDVISALNDFENYFLVLAKTLLKEYHQSMIFRKFQIDFY